MSKFIGIVIIVLAFYVGLIIGMLCFDYNERTITTKNKTSISQNEVEKTIDLFDIGFEYEEHFM